LESEEVRVVEEIPTRKRRRSSDNDEDLFNPSDIRKKDGRGRKRKKTSKR